MFFEREETIRSRAHALWLHEGRPEGRALDHWLAAQRDHADADMVLPRYDAATGSDETIWMRRSLWTPQPFLG